jgi:hypothetical protein
MAAAHELYHCPLEVSIRELMIAEWLAGNDKAGRPSCAADVVVLYSGLEN